MFLPRTLYPLFLRQCSLNTLVKLQSVSSPFLSALHSTMPTLTDLSITSSLVTPNLPPLLYMASGLQHLSFPSSHYKLLTQSFKNEVEPRLFAFFPSLSLSFENSFIELSCQWSGHCRDVKVSNFQTDLFSTFTNTNKSLLLDFSFCFPYVDLSSFLSSQPSVLSSVVLYHAPSSAIPALLDSLANQPLKELSIEYGSFSRWCSTVDPDTLLHSHQELTVSSIRQSQVLLKFSKLRVLNCEMSSNSPLFDVVSKLPKLRELNGVEINPNQILPEFACLIKLKGCLDSIFNDVTKARADLFSKISVTLREIELDCRGILVESIPRSIKEVKITGNTKTFSNNFSPILSVNRICNHGLFRCNDCF
ncbi:hypothetical protein P9112_005400 [Eukaryota sp. TZLM1-RC]